MFHVVLIEPEIPPNTGSIGRLCLATGSRLHLVGPLGFDLGTAALRRAGLDYWHQVDVHRWHSLDELRATVELGATFYYFTTKTRRPFWDATFRDGDYLVFGRETKGLPESLLSAHSETCLTIPIREEARSLNLATSAGIALYEALRQIRPTT